MGKSDLSCGEYPVQYSARDGYSIVTPEGKKYDLVEACALGGAATYDLLMILDVTDSNAWYLIGCSFGATYFEEDQSMRDFIGKTIEKYETTGKYMTQL